MRSRAWRDIEICMRWSRKKTSGRSCKREGTCLGGRASEPTSEGGRRDAERDGMGRGGHQATRPLTDIRSHVSASCVGIINTARVPCAERFEAPSLEDAYADALFCFTDRRRVRILTWHRGRPSKISPSWLVFLRGGCAPKTSATSRVDNAIPSASEHPRALALFNGAPGGEYHKVRRARTAHGALAVCASPRNTVNHVRVRTHRG